MYAVARNSDPRTMMGGYTATIQIVARARGFESLSRVVAGVPPAEAGLDFGHQGCAGAAGFVLAATISKSALISLPQM